MSPQRYSPEAPQGGKRSQQSGRGNLGGSRSFFLPMKCVRCEVTEPLNTYFSTPTRGSRKKDAARPDAAGSSVTLHPDAPHVSVVTVSLSRSSIHDGDVATRLLPYLEDHLLKVPCPVHAKDCGTKRIIWTNLDLSENHLGDAGITTLVNWWMSHLHVLRLRSLKLYKNVIADEGAAALGRLINVHPWPIEEIHLSHNILTDEGAETLLKSFLFVNPQGQSPCPNSVRSDGQSVRSVYPRLDPHRGVFLPVWMRLEYNHIVNCDEVLRRTSQALADSRATDLLSRCDATRVACFAERLGSPSMKDPNCSPKRCSRSTPASAPLFHLYSFSHQLATAPAAATAAASPLHTSPALHTKSLSPSTNVSPPKHLIGGLGRGSQSSRNPARVSPAATMVRNDDSGKVAKVDTAEGSKNGSLVKPVDKRGGKGRRPRPTANTLFSGPSSASSQMPRPAGKPAESENLPPPKSSPLYVFLDGTAFLVMSTLDVTLRNDGSQYSPHGGSARQSRDIMPFTWRSLAARLAASSMMNLPTPSTSYPKGGGYQPACDTTSDANENDQVGSSSQQPPSVYSASNHLLQPPCSASTSSSSSLSGQSSSLLKNELQVISFQSADVEFQSLLPLQPQHVQLALESAETSCIAALSANGSRPTFVRLPDGTTIPNQSSGRGLTSMEAGVAKTEFLLATNIIRLVDSILKFLPEPVSEESHLLLTESRDLLAFISWLREHRASQRSSSTPISAHSFPRHYSTDSAVPSFPKLHVSYVNPFNKALASRIQDQPNIDFVGNIRATFPLIDTFMRSDHQQDPRQPCRKVSVPKSSSWGHRSADGDVVRQPATVSYPHPQSVYNPPPVSLGVEGAAFSDFGKMSPQDLRCMRPSPSPHARRNVSGGTSSEHDHRLGRAASDVPVCDDLPPPGPLPLYTPKGADWGDATDLTNISNHRDTWQRPTYKEVISAEISNALRDVSQLLHQLEQLKPLLPSSQEVEQQSKAPSSVASMSSEEPEAARDQSALEKVEHCMVLGQRLFDRWGALASHCFPQEFVQRDWTAVNTDGPSSSRTTDTTYAQPGAPLLQDSGGNDTPPGSRLPDGRQPVYFTQLVNKLNSLIQGSVPPAPATPQQSQSCTDPYGLPMWGKQH
eukprot:Blabericola_migrator_1__2695@NODE_1766_length_3824_cov_139_495874_g1139_i0_p1_GENE_NODE_1766_length_3824_cov_139_495874_g1139_i0NODE_1766_length_3824_cov_139_495874_g1139_i0_p1_ORF_typecomplete_len1130_score138_25LRR_6/PF13516_6/0_0098LRR_6/PF13516_6/3LRR_6/PF13516_6/1_3LRR_8/PF13855_6/0_64_NODE_1766_length_3824_cov_139_495874_g1139_i01073496